MLPLAQSCGRACRPASSRTQAASTKLLVSAKLLASPSCQPRLFHSSRPLHASAPRISYRVAASSSAKTSRFHPAKNAYNFDPERQDALGVATDTSNVKLRRRLRPDSGEDAWFVSNVGRRNTSNKKTDNDRAIAFAVADGVGGWAESGVDPGDFSHALCGYMAQSALDHDAPLHQLRAKQLLQTGYDQVVEDGSIKAGGSTASVGVAFPDGRVELANLGDSGSMLLRLAAVQHYSLPQTHGFNTPYQLSIIPPALRIKTAKFGGLNFEDFPRDAATTSLQMQHGDVLMLATDGVYDNLSIQDVLRTVTGRMIQTGAWTASPDSGVEISQTLQQLTTPDGLAELMRSELPAAALADPEMKHLFTLQALLAVSVAGDAKLASLNRRRDGPFAKEAQRYYLGDPSFRGGKVDDISVVMIVAVDENLSQT